VDILGSDPAVDVLAVKRQVGYVPEQQFIHRWMRVGEAIHFCRSLFPTWNDERCTELLRLFDLEPDKKVKHLSKGMAVKLSLLLALAHDPELLILDEPMAGLDPVIREELLDGVLRAVCDRKQTILFSSHTLSDVQRLADTVGIIHEGELLVHSEVDTLLRDVKRIRGVLKDGASPKVPPEGMIWQRVREREWLVTVEGFSGDMVERLKAENDVEQVEVIDLGLEGIFKDYVRGWRASP
jgi:ABC-2 type transport system ATP-binding protein